MLEDKRQKEAKHKQEGFQGKGKGETVEKRERALSEGGGTAGKAQRGEGVDGRDGGRRRCCEEGTRKVPAQPRTKQVQAMRRIGHLRAQPRKEVLQAMRRDGHLRAQPPKKRVQAMRRG